MQDQVLLGAQEGMRWKQPAFLSTVSLVHTCIQTSEGSKGRCHGLGLGEGHVYNKNCNIAKLVISSCQGPATGTSQ